MSDEVKFWIAVLAALAVKMILSTSMSAWQALAASASGLFVAWVFTDPIIAWAGLDSALYRVPIAALLALTGEQIVRRLIRYSEKPDQLHEDIRKWRGK